MSSDKAISLDDRRGGYREVLRLAIPLILSNSFWTLQLTIDRILLSRYNSESVGAAMAANVLYWTYFALLYNTAGYASTFVAQYIGASRPHRIGPVVWQSIYFALFSGMASLLFLPLSGWIIGLGGHAQELQEQEQIYFNWLCLAALPMLITSATTSFFLGRGQNWPVMAVNALGMAVNVILDYGLIYGNWGFPEWGVFGAGLATVIGSWCAAFLALGLFLQPRFAREFGTWKNKAFDFSLFTRLMRFGLPAGLQWSLEGLAITVVVFFIGRMGPAEQSATSIAFTLNMVVFLPTMGIAQAVSILVGQRLGQNRPDLARLSTWRGFSLAWIFMTLVGLTYVLIPDLYLALFRTQGEDQTWPEVAAIVPTLLRFVALYCLFDSMNLVFSFALKGAGDTRFVTLTSLLLSWPLMVLPTWLAWNFDLGLFWAWVFISVYVISLGVIFLLRFLQGKWQSMRVIESSPPDKEGPSPEGMKELITEPLVAS